ncbi:predicted protein, partial [Nematostella vectensis]
KTSTLPFGSEDVVYKGSTSKWKGLAYALLARYNNHLSKRDPVGSATKALDFVNKAVTAGFSSNAANFLFPYDGSSDWQNPWFSLFQNNLIVASKKFMDVLKSTNDPRRIAYFQDVDVQGNSVGFVGKPNGSPINAKFSPVGPKTFYGKKNSPQFVSTYFELKFIEAEAALRLATPDKARAATAMNEAIKSQIDLVTTDLKNAMSGAAKVAYEAEIAAYKATFANETAATITLDKLMTEKRKAMFTMNLESWVDVRRHDYLIPSNIALPLNAKLPTFIRRGLYTETSKSRNANTPTGVKLQDKLWWDQ